MDPYLPFDRSIKGFYPHEILTAGMDTQPRGVRSMLALSWQEHRRYVWFATGLFAVGILVGIGFVFGNVDLLGALGVDNLQDVFPEEFTTWTILLNNTQAFLIMIVGAITFGVVTFIGAFFNGVLIGFVAVPAVAESGIAATLVLLLPHGIFELPALFIAGGIGFRLVHLGVNRLRRTRKQFVTRGEARRIGVLAMAGWGLLVIAAIIEVNITPVIYETLFGASPT